MKKFLVTFAGVLILHLLTTNGLASPLPAGTTLTVTAGVGNSGNLGAAQPGTGSAFSMKCCGPNPLWTDIPAPALGGLGTDGGIVIGTNQASGGEDLATGVTTPGGIDAAWFFFSSYGTDYTPDGATLNAFAGTSCTSGLGTTACSNGTGDLTRLGSWQVAWNGLSVTMGGGKIDAWIVSGSLYTLNYRQTVPSGDPSGFGGVAYGLHLEGIIASVVPPATPTSTPTPTSATTVTATPTNTPTPTNSPTATPTPFTTVIPLSGLLSVDPGIIDDVTGLYQTGSYFTMSGSPNVSSAMLSPGPSGGVLLGVYQPFVLNPDVCANTPPGGLPGTGYTSPPTTESDILLPFGFFGINTYVGTNPIAYQSCTAHPVPSAETDGAGNLRANLSAWEVMWNGTAFEQGPRIGTPSAPVSIYATGTFDAGTGKYMLNWPALIVGGPFNGVTGHWHLEGFVIPPTPTPTDTPTSTPTDTPTPIPTNTATPTPTNTPTTCEANWPVTAIQTIGKGQSAANNMKLSHTITGNIVNPNSYGLTASRIVFCAGTSVTVIVTDTTGTPAVTADSAGISCTPSGCSVPSLTAREKYIAVSHDGSDTDRFTLLPQ